MIMLLGMFLPVCAGNAAAGAALVERLLAAYDAIETVSCDIRRGWQGPDGRVRMNSRVHWQRPNLMHVDNYSPMRRRYVCTGERLYYHIQGDPRGFSRRVEELDDDWRLRLKVVPGTAMDYLLPLQGIDEIELENSEEGVLRRGYRLTGSYVVLFIDVHQRLVRYEQFSSPEALRPLTAIVFSRFEEVLEGVFIPLLHETTVLLDGEERAETTRVSIVSINKPLAPLLFDPDPYFKDVEFVESFEKVYRQP